MIELKCKGSVEFAEKIEIQARETFGDYGILIGRDGDKVRMEVSYVNDQFDERNFIEFLKSVDCTFPIDSIFYLNEGVVWKKDAYKLCYIKKEELQSVCQNVNQTQVEDTEFLSDNIFSFDINNGFQQITFTDRNMQLSR